MVGVDITGGFGLSIVNRLVREYRYNNLYSEKKIT